MSSQDLDSNSDKIALNLLNTDPSSFWKFVVDKFTLTLTEQEKQNFALAAGKFAEKQPHLYVKEVPWFKTWYKENKDKYTF